MARRKHAAALFEVFHEKKSSPRSASSPWSSLFKGRSRGAEAEAPAAMVDENDPTTMTIRSPLIAPRIAAVEAMPVAPPRPTPEPKPVEAPKVSAAPSASAAAVGRGEVRDEVAVLREKFASTAAPSPTAPEAPPESSTHFHFNRDAREISLRLPLNSALIAASCLVLSVGIAYVVGRHIGNNEAAAAQFAKETRLPEVRTSALDLPRRANRVVATPTAVKPAPRAYADDAVYHDSAPSANSVKDITPLPRPSASGDEPRIIGLNYLLIQSYPTQASANEARDFLAQNGIACTVEKVPAIFYCPDPAWRSVITTRGFDKEHYRSPEYEAFKKQIEKLNEKFAGNAKFKRFALQPYQLK